MKQQHPRVLEYVWRSRGGIGKHVASLCERVPGTTVLADADTARHFGWRGANLLQIARIGRRADIVHAHGIRAGAWASIWARKLIVTIHTKPDQRRSTRLLLRWLAAKADLLTVVSQQAQNILARQGIAAKLVPNASALASELLEKPVLSDAERAELAARNGWTEPIILTIGRNSPEKNLPLAATVMERLKAATAAEPQIGTGIIIGPGAGPQSALGQAHPQLCCYDAAPDISQYLQAASVLLLTSKSEATPYVVDEALAAGVPVVATAVGDVALHVRGGGICVPNDAADLPAQLVTALQQVLAAPGQYRRGARTAALALTTISDVARFWEREYLELAGIPTTENAS